MLQSLSQKDVEVIHFHWWRVTFNEKQSQMKVVVWLASGTQAFHSRKKSLGLPPETVVQYAQYHNNNFKGMS